MSDPNLPPDIDVSFPNPSGLQVTREHPYRLLYVADFAGGAAGTLQGPLASGVCDVNPDTFDDLMQAAQPTVTLKITDPTVPGNALTELTLRFDALKCFQPAALLDQLPATRTLNQVRALVVDRLLNKRTADQFSAEIGRHAGDAPELHWLSDALKWSASNTPAPASDADIDDVLGQLDLGDTGDAPPPKSKIGSLVSAAATSGGSALPAAETAALRRTLTEIDRRLSAWLNALYRAEPVQRLESAWRGLAFLIAHTDFRKGLHVSVLHTPRGELVERFATLVIDPVFDEGAAAPDLIIVDEIFAPSAPDIELLDGLAQHCASLPALALAGVGAEFFGVKFPWQVATLPAFVSHFDQWQYAKYKSLRQEPYARMLGLVFGRGLLRQPYEHKGDSELAFSFKQECISDRDLLWTTGPVAAACNVARSMAEHGWPTNLVGRLGGWQTATGGKQGDKTFGPADTAMPFDKAQEMAAAGLNALISLPHESDAVLCNGFSVAYPTRSEGSSILEVSLPYQLFAGRLSALLLELRPHLSGKSQDEVAAYVHSHVRDWLGTETTAPDDQQIAVQARPADDDPAALQLAVTVTPPLNILPGAIPVVLGYKIK